MSDNFKDYSKIYAPQTTNDIYSNFNQIFEIKKFLKNYEEDPKKKIADKILLILGPSGSCKTTICKAIFNECNYEPVKFDLFANSDIKKDILQSISHNTFDCFFSKRKKILFLDDIDLMCQYEKSLTTFITGILKKIHIPIICTANSLDDKKISEIKKKSSKIYLNKIGFNECYQFIMNVIAKENLDIDLGKMLDVIKKNNNDIRLILANLQKFINTDGEDVSNTNSVLSEKDQFIDYSLFDFTKKILEKKLTSTEIGNVIDIENSLVSLLLHENIISELSKIKNKTSNKLKCLDSLISISDSYIAADKFENYVFANNDWGFYNTVATVKISAINYHSNNYQKNNTISKLPVFTQLLTKSSLRFCYKKKKKNLLSKLHIDFVQSDFILQLLLDFVKNSDDSHIFDSNDIDCLTKYGETFDLISGDDRKKLMDKNKKNIKNIDDSAIYTVEKLNNDIKKIKINKDNKKKKKNS
jgi:SpoVK/Ycf46/Vps4 family AAA+-type ATPase